MEKRVTIRLDEGTYMLIEANAKKQGKSVSSWLRDAIHEHVRGNIERQIMDRLDERVYEVMKNVTEIKKVMAHGFGETKKGFVLMEQKIDSLVVEVQEE